MKEDIHRYDDIINLPHHQSQRRPPMSLHDRAAQFSPFAALTGHSEAIAETARLTAVKPELSEDQAAQLDEALAAVLARLPEPTRIRVVHFVPDARKAGGAYAEKCGEIQKVDTLEKALLFTDGEKILLDNILKISMVQAP